MKNSKLKALVANARFEAKADKSFIDLNEALASSIRGGADMKRPAPLPNMNIACDSSCSD